MIRKQNKVKRTHSYSEKFHYKLIVSLSYERHDSKQLVHMDHHEVSWSKGAELRDLSYYED